MSGKEFFQQGVDGARAFEDLKTLGGKLAIFVEVVDVLLQVV